MNEVYISGRVKRDAKQNDGVLDFAMEVGDNTRSYIIDCVCFERSDAFKELEGFVTAGEDLAFVGRLTRRTQSEAQRLAGVWVDIRQTQTVVVVDAIMEEDDNDNQ